MRAIADAQSFSGRGSLAQRGRGLGDHAVLPESRPNRPWGKPPSALFFISGDLASGAGNLIDELLRTAGFRNAAADYGLSFTGTVPLETLLARPPAVIISTGQGRSAALRRRLLPNVPEAAFPRALINCGGPSIPPALEQLRAIRARL